MSKLSTLIRRTTRSEPAPMGFAAIGGRTKSPELLIAASLDDLSLEDAKAAATAGADVLLLDNADLNDDADAIRAITAGVSIPCGARVQKAGADPAVARGLGLDYVRIDDDETPAAALQDEELGFVLAVDQDASDTFLRLLESMPFDALYAGKVSGPFTIRDQIQLRRVSGLARKPLVVRIEDRFGSTDLEALRDTGVGVLLASGDSSLNERIGDLRRAVEGMRPRNRRRGDRQEAVAVIPSVAQRGDDHEEEEE